MSTVQPSIISDVYPTYGSYNDAGFANSQGIVFSGMKPHVNVPVSPSNSNPILHPIISIPSNHVSGSNEPTGQSSNVNHILDFVENQSPFNNPYSQPQQVPQRPDKPQSSFSSGGFTFAPLLSASALPMAQQTTSSSSNQVNTINKKPSSSATSQSNKTPGSSKCGITNYTHSRVVGGTITQIGQYPWIAALGYRFPNVTLTGIQFYCAGSLVSVF